MLGNMLYYCAKEGKMNKKEVSASKAKEKLENMTVEEMFKLLCKTDREFVRDYIERAVLESESELPTTN